MNEDPKKHDFDQRHDGPFEAAQADPEKPGRPSLQTSLLPAPQRHVSEPLQDTGTTSPSSAPDGIPGKTRKSVQLPRKSEQLVRKSEQLVRKSEDPGRPPRTSTAMSRSGRPSRDFDIRRDGPYGRPSLNMQRRRSSGTGMSTAEPAEARDGREGSIAPDPAMLEAMPTSAEEQAAYEPEPPPLNYNLWERKWFIVLFWSMIIIDVVGQPIALYFGLWYGLTRKQLSANAVFSIVTAAIGGVSIFEYVLRFWRLFKKGSTCRVIGARRMYLDWFHWNFSLGWAIIMIELIVGTIPENPPIRLLSMPLASMLYAFGTELLIVDTLRYFQIPSPCRMSSIPKGAQLRPAIYTVIEDVIAVDGSGGTAYREALNKRYESSHMFRAMLRRLGIFWSFGAEGMAVVTTILVFTITGEAAYVVGWSAPFAWAGIWTLLTIWYVKGQLKQEKKAWAEEIAEKQGAIAMMSREGNSLRDANSSRELNSME
ncbi:Hypothetical predicted protein [Lecanosticta acicola]|uniref:Uncharacterized protein n=1 Tax=Lecanosticta acicola TaxID=111012 RepID=A0AAI9E847_9PEZI|nr:Hypothetical predicted protein [Lecanosticta acicola]